MPLDLTRAEADYFAASGSRSLHKGKEAVLRGDFDAALLLFERAHRFIPLDGAVLLSLGTLLARLADRRALPLLEAGLQSFDVGQARLLLVAAQQKHGLPAVASLAVLLSQHALPEAHWAASLFLAICRAEKQVGWCGVTTGGKLMVGVDVPLDLTRLSVQLDGVEVDLAAEALSPELLIAGLPEKWASVRTIEVTVSGIHALGSPILPGTIRNLEGFVSAFQGDLSGWVWCPNDPLFDPEVKVTSDTGATLSLICDQQCTNIGHPNAFALPRKISISKDCLGNVGGALRVTGPRDQQLYGSPLDPAFWSQAAVAAAESISRATGGLVSRGKVSKSLSGQAVCFPPAIVVGRRPRSQRILRQVDVIIPVHKARDEAVACIESVMSSLPDWAQIVVVEDGPSEAILGGYLTALAAAGIIKVLRHKENSGFPAAANLGLRNSPANDAVLLNSDTLVPPGWLQRLRVAAYSANELGTVTPLSNNATILSYPRPNYCNDPPDFESTVILDSLARQANGDETVDIPTGVGFCMYFRRDCLSDVGLLREDVFAQGYGEENDFCIRARHLGWRHVCVTGVFVTHLGGRSFNPASSYLQSQNSHMMNMLHPGYDALIATNSQEPKLALARRRLELEVLKARRDYSGAVVITANYIDSSVRRMIAERCRAASAEGLRPLLLMPRPERAGLHALGHSDNWQESNLTFDLPADIARFVALLEDVGIVRTEILHLKGNCTVLLDICRSTSVPYIVFVTDYSVLCPALWLDAIARDRDVDDPLAACETCMFAQPILSQGSLGSTGLGGKAAALLNGAERVVVPSHDVLARLSRYSSKPIYVVNPWEPDPPFTPPERGSVKRSPSDAIVAVFGQIGTDQGFEVLLALARDASDRDLALSFVLIGFSADDDKLDSTGRVIITGPCSEQDAIRVVSEVDAGFALRPSARPDVWSYELSLAWSCGLKVAAFNSGTSAERIRKTGWGWVFPPYLSTSEINDFLLSLSG